MSLLLTGISYIYILTQLKQEKLQNFVRVSSLKIISLKASSEDVFTADFTAVYVGVRYIFPDHNSMSLTRFFSHVYTGLAELNTVPRLS